MEDRRTNGLRTLRWVARSFVFTLLAIGVVVFLLRDAERRTDGALVWSGAIVGLAMLLRIVGGAFEPKLDASTDETLASSYSTRMFVRLSLGELPALVAFVGSFVGPWWTYYVGLAVALPAIARAMPSPRNIARDDEELVLSGSSRRLESVLGSFYVRRG